jgi:hypothetical protein
VVGIREESIASNGRICSFQWKSSISIKQKRVGGSDALGVRKGTRKETGVF